MSRKRTEVVTPGRPRRRAPSPLVIAILLLGLGFGGLVLWLQLSYVAPGDTATTRAGSGAVVVEVAPPETETPPAATAETQADPIDTPTPAPSTPAPAPAPTEAKPAAPPADAPRWARHAQAFTAPAGQPLVAIVIWGLGLSRADTKAAIQQLPAEVTLAFAPYGRNLQDWADQAHTLGHETVLQVPMEPYGYPKNDPGPHTLLTTLPAEANIERLDWVLDRFQGYVAVTNQLGARFARSAEHLTPVLRALAAREVIFLDSRRGGEALGYELAGVVGLDRLANDHFIDDKVEREAIDAALAALEETARDRGHAIGIGFPFPLTIRRLRLWVDRLATRGIALAPLSAVHRAARKE